MTHDSGHGAGRVNGRVASTPIRADGPKRRAPGVVCGWFSKSSSERAVMVGPVVVKITAHEECDHHDQGGK
jgi:hypothetical protein